MSKRRTAMLLGSRFGRRIFLSLVVTALFPVLIFGSLFTVYQRIAEKQADQDQLRTLVNSYSALIYESLMLADQTFANDPTQAQRDLYITGFEFTTEREWTNKRGHALSHGEINHLTNGDSLLHVDSRQGRPNVFLVRQHGDQGDLVVAQLAPRKLKRLSNVLPEGRVASCVLIRDVPWFCSHTDAANVPWAEIGRRRGYVADTGIEGYASSYSETLFITPRFLAREWVVVMLKNAIDTSSRISPTDIAYPVLALALLVAWWVGAAQLRRNLVPLRALQQGARSIAQGELGNQVETLGSEEFDEVAESFNVMSIRLEQQFTASRGLSEIDQAITRDLPLQDILQRVMQQLLQIRDDACAANAVVSETLGIHATLYTLRPDQKVVDSADLEECLVPTCYQQEPEFLTNADLHTSYPSLITPGAGTTCVLALCADDMKALLALQVPAENEQFDDDETRRFCELGERLKVALSAKAKERKLQYLAFYDPLTQLPGRRLMLDRLHQAIALAKRSGRLGAVLFVDLDRFKNVNDSYGHPVGDLLLMQIAHTLSEQLRDSDTIARFGGDEFVAILSGIDNPRQAELTAKRLIEAVSKMFKVEDLELYVGASVGIACFPNDSTDPTALLSYADSAMYDAKQSGRGRFATFNRATAGDTRRIVEMEHALRLALQHNQLKLHYQPQVRTEDGTVVGMEALIRWTHPDLGTISPQLFVPLAEDSGLIREIGAWALETACQDARRLFAEPGNESLRVAVNISPKQFTNDNLAVLIGRTLESSGLDPSRLDVEITESSLVDDFEMAEHVLGRLRDLGVRVSMDDFGTGYSSFAYLYKLPFTSIKLDREFISRIVDSKSGRDVVHAAIRMVKSLDKQVVAEGVETEEQWNYLRQFGCDELQGYFVARPQPIEKLRQFLRNWQAPAQVRKDSSRLLSSA